MFSDTLPDFTAWQTTSGGFSFSAGLLTANGAGSSSDLAVVRNSQDYQDGTLTVRATPLTVGPQLVGGAVVRYRDTSNFYLCGLTKNAVVVQRRLAGTDSRLLAFPDRGLLRRAQSGCRVRAGKAVPRLQQEHG